MTDLDRQREAAIETIEAKRDFATHAAFFVVANIVKAGSMPDSIGRSLSSQPAPAAHHYG